MPVPLVVSHTSKRQSVEETEIRVACVCVFVSMNVRYIFKDDRP